MNWSSERVVLLFGGRGSERVSRDGKALVSEAMQQLGIKPIEIDIKDRLVDH